ncbi:hypothetical protein AAOGI_41390 [Agarivorans albus]
MKYFLLLVLLVSINSHAVEWGVFKRVSFVYVKTDSGPPYIQFQSGAMPGCYQNAGGYLSGNDISIAYSTILAAKMAGKEVRPLYQINEGATGWGMCTIKSFYLK